VSGENVHAGEKEI